MSRMSAFFARLLNSKNIAPSLNTALVDDATVPPPDPGEPTALRVDPTTGELLVKTAGGGGGGGDASAAKQDEQTALLTTLTTSTGSDGAAVPAKATQIGGSDGTNLHTLTLLKTAPTTQYGVVVRVAGAVDTELPAAALLADNTSTPTAPAVGSFGMLYDGTNWDPQRGDGSGRTVVAGNVAEGSAAALPVTVGGVDTGGLSRRWVGEQVGSYLHQYVKVTNNVAVQAPSGAALALDSTLTGGTQKAIVRGGAKGATTAADATTTAQGADHQAVDVQLYHGGTAKDPAAIRALTATDVVSADMRVASAAVSHTNPAPIVEARSARAANGTTLPAAATTHTLSNSPGMLRRLEWRYTGGGTKYIVLCDQAGGTAAAANWIKWYRAMSNGAGLSFFEWPEGIYFSAGIVLGVSATEPAANTAITLSSAANENFHPVFWSIQP